MNPFIQELANENMTTTVCLCWMIHVYEQAYFAEST